MSKQVQCESGSRRGGVFSRLAHHHHRDAEVPGRVWCCAMEGPEPHAANTKRAFGYVPARPPRAKSKRAEEQQ